VTYLWAGLTIALMAASQALNLFSLPANWVLTGLAALWAWTHPDGGVGWGFVALLLGGSALGEVLEYWLQARQSRLSGASSKGNVAGLVGAVLGAVLGAPLLFGLGAILGALAGAYLGCLLMEKLSGKPWAESARAAKGAFTGKMLGFMAKVALGAGMFVLAAPRIWPG
jgi:hypothetical protein